MDSIQAIVQQALKSGVLTPAMESEVSRLSERVCELPLEDYLALDELMLALASGAVALLPQKQFINVMEALVLREAAARCVKMKNEDQKVDIGEVTAYALNRLPPLYATTEEGAHFQRDRAESEMAPLIAEQVNEAIAQSLSQQNYFPERQPLQQEFCQPKRLMMRQVSELLSINALNLNEQAGRKVNSQRE